MSAFRTDARSKLYTGKFPRRLPHLLDSLQGYGWVWINSLQKVISEYYYSTLRFNFVSSSKFVCTDKIVEDRHVVVVCVARGLSLVISEGLKQHADLICLRDLSARTTPTT